MKANGRVVKWTTFDVAKGLLALLPRDELPATSSVLHTALRRVAAKRRFAPFLKGYAFDNRHPFPFCAAFQTDLVNLEMAGHLTTANPDLVKLRRTGKLKTTFDQYGSKLFSKPEQETLAEMAQAFSNEFGQPTA